MSLKYTHGELYYQGGLPGLSSLRSDGIGTVRQKAGPRKRQSNALKTKLTKEGAPSGLSPL